MKRGPVKYLSGQRFTRLLVIREAGRAANGAVKWECLCDCGTVVYRSTGKLNIGRAKSCGCIRKDAGEVRAERKVWGQMIRRCTETLDESYPHYGGRGIKVCDRWMNSFDNFLRDLGPRPKDPEWWSGERSYWSIDRIDVNGDYEPGNVRWATPDQQRANQKGYSVAAPPPPPTVKK